MGLHVRFKQKKTKRFYLLAKVKGNMEKACLIVPSKLTSLRLLCEAILVENTSTIAEDVHRKVVLLIDALQQQPAVPLLPLEQTLVDREKCFNGVLSMLDNLWEELSVPIVSPSSETTTAAAAADGNHSDDREEVRDDLSCAIDSARRQIRFLIQSIKTRRTSVSTFHRTRCIESPTEASSLAKGDLVEEWRSHVKAFVDLSAAAGVDDDDNDSEE